VAIYTSIDPDRQLVISHADNVILLSDLVTYLDALVTENLMSYAKLFDAGDQETLMGDEGVMTMAARVNAYALLDPRGPLAFVARANSTRDVIRRVMNVDRSKRSAMLFERQRDALAWLGPHLKQ
jgi:hypothetical protein